MRYKFWRNLYRNPRFFGLLVILVAIGFLVFEAVEEERQMDYFLQEPGQGMMPSSSSQQLSPSDPHVLDLEEGLELSVPAQAFVDDSGKLASGDIMLHYRWLPDAKTWLERGLPMEDASHIYASKGVLELYALQAGQVLSLAPGKELLLRIASMETQPSYHPMQLDTALRIWAPITDTSWVQLWDSSALTQLEPKPEWDPAEVALVAKAAARPPKAPSKPFGVNISNAADYPVFRPYQKVYWEYLPGPQSSNPWTEQLLGEENGWNDVRIRRTGEKEYTLTFMKIGPEGQLIRKRVKARPLFEASTKAEADAWYQRQLSRHSAILDSLKQDEQTYISSENQKYRERLQRWEQRKENGVQFEGSLCHIRLKKLGFVSMMKPLEQEEKAPKLPSGGERWWWSDQSGEKLIELSGSNFGGTLPVNDSAFLWKLDKGKVKEIQIPHN